MRSSHKLARDGGVFAAHRVLCPPGAKKKPTKLAARCIPSYLYPEKSCAAETNDRNITKQMSSMPRGHKFSTSNTEAAMPIQQSATSARSLESSHSSVGANQ